MKVRFWVSGMTCSACSARIEKSVARINGASKVAVNLLTGKMDVDVERDEVVDEIIKAVTSLGYGIGKDGEERVEERDDGEIKGMKTRLIVSVCFCIPLLLISMGEMFFHLIKVETPAFLEKAFYSDESAVVFALTQIILLIPIVFANQSYFKRGFSALIKRSPNMDTLVSLGAFSAIIYGFFALIMIGYGFGYGKMDLVTKYSQDLYFESAGTILTLITVGKYLETLSKGKTKSALKRLTSLTPDRVTVERNGEEKVVMATDVVVGDIFILRPGERVGVDGVIEQGNTTFDQSAITGESVPVEKSVGDTVVSATVNISGYVKCRATSVGKDTTIAKIIKLVEETSSTKAPIARLADKISAVFVPIVMGIALVAFVVWLACGYGLEFALARGISVLVISCPCALGLATPVAIMVGTGKGAENGILFKSGESLETLQRVKTVVFDKTGTVTEGKPEVSDIIAIKGEEREILYLSASAEKASEHPLGKAVIEKAKARGISLAEVKSFVATFGKGIAGDVDGRKVFVGNAEFAKEFGAETAVVDEELERLAKLGKTPLTVGENGEVIGVVAVSDTVKNSSKNAINSLKTQKIRTVLLTGDNRFTANRVASEIGVDDVIFEVLPAEKESVITKLKENGGVAMVGDGINDAPALVSANVGIAIGAGTDIAIDSADVVLVSGDMNSVPNAIALSKKVVRNIKQNLFWAFVYNAIGIPVASGVLYPLFGIVLSPMIGAMAMSLSSVCVVTNALRLKKIKFSTSSFGETPVGETLKVRGMTCMHCEKRVKDALTAVDGVKNVVVDLEKGLVTVEKEGFVGKKELIKAVVSAGYKAK